jgi:YHS domain-containing protein
MIRRAFLTAALCLLATHAPAADERERIHTGWFSSLAVGGYDTVAYHTQGEAVQGSEAWETEFLGATWRFASQENLERFLEDPDRYRPAYGGHCAWAVAQGYTAKGDPRFWTIVDGRLFLNYSAKVQRDWLEDVPGFVRKADGNWPGVLR